MSKKIFYYTKKKIIGKGAFGVVYKAFNPKTNQWVALKQQRNLKKQLLSHILKETYILQDVSKLNPHLLSVYRVFMYRGDLWYEMPLASENLTKFLSNLKKIPKKNKLSVLKKLVNEIGCGLQSLHDLKILHSDLKPANILYLPINLSSKGIKELNYLDDGEWVLGDFGLSNFLDSNIKSMSGGTPKYLPPEDWCSEEFKPNIQKKFYTTSRDMYSFGLIMLEVAINFLKLTKKLIKIADLNIIKIQPLIEKDLPNISELKANELCLNIHKKLKNSSLKRKHINLSKKLKAKEILNRVFPSQSKLIEKIKIPYFIETLIILSYGATDFYPSLRTDASSFTKCNNHYRSSLFTTSQSKHKKLKLLNYEQKFIQFINKMSSKRNFTKQIKEQIYYAFYVTRQVFHNQFDSQMISNKKRSSKLREQKQIFQLFFILQLLFSRRLEQALYSKISQKFWKFKNEKEIRQGVLKVLDSLFKSDAPKYILENMLLNSQFDYQL